MIPANKSKMPFRLCHIKSVQGENWIGQRSIERDK